MFRRIFRIMVGLAVALVVLLVGLYAYFWYTPVPNPPHTSATIQSGATQVGGLRRTYRYYVPADLPAHAPLLFVFHGSLEDSQTIRVATGYEFETLADAQKFVVVYPDGYMGNWDDCRSQATYPAHTQHIDDVGLVRALIGHFQAANQIDPGRVFAMGYSNGGEMVNRLAVEMPDTIAGVATVAANLPAANNNDCPLSGKPIPALIMAGTRDPINPFQGGVISLFGFQPRGEVISSPATAQYFARLDGYSTPSSQLRLPHRASSGVASVGSAGVASTGIDSTSVDVIDYQAAGKDEVEEYIIDGGGHVIPQPIFSAPRLLGPTTLDVDAPSAIWAFFARIRTK